MNAQPIDDLRLAQSAISAWLAVAKSSADPAGTLQSSSKILSAALKRGATAIATIREANAATDEWEKEYGGYRSSLAALKSQLEHIEIILRMRVTSLKRRRSKIDALRSWANLTRNIQ